MRILNNKLLRIIGIIGIVAILLQQFVLPGLLKSRTAYAVGEMTVDWGVPEGNPIFNEQNSAPGDVFTHEVNVQNGSSVARQVGVKGLLETDPNNLESVMTIEILEGVTSLYGPKTLNEFFADSANINGIALSTLSAGLGTEYIFRVVFDEDAGNKFQGALPIVFDLQIGIISDIPVACEDMNLNGATIFGTAGNDNLRGTTKNDLIIALEGNDTVNGGVGNDCIVGGDGNDNLNGAVGNDMVVGGLGGDTVEGGAGNDMLDGGSDNDTISGGPGNNTLTGGEGSDTLQGGASNDLINGNAGNDIMTGGAGNDFMTGGTGTDTFNGNTGRDTCVHDGVETLLSCEVKVP